MAEPDLTAELDRIHQRYRTSFTTLPGYSSTLRATTWTHVNSADDVPLLLAALRAVLELAGEAIPALGAIRCTCAGNGSDDTCRCPESPVAWTLDPSKVREAITREITGKGESDGQQQG